MVKLPKVAQIRKWITVLNNFDLPKTGLTGNR